VIEKKGIENTQKNSIGKSGTVNNTLKEAGIVNMTMEKAKNLDTVSQTIKPTLINIFPGYICDELEKRTS